MNVGDVVFFKGTSPISLLIRKFTKSDYSHVGLVVGDGLILEADRFMKTRIREFDFDKEVHVVYTHEDPLNVGQKNRIAMIAKDYEGTSYDWLLIFSLFLKSVFRTKGSLFNRANAYICSEVIDVVLYSSGVRRNRGLPIGFVSPQDLFTVYRLRKDTNA